MMSRLFRVPSSEIRFPCRRRRIRGARARSVQTQERSTVDESSEESSQGLSIYR